MCKHHLPDLVRAMCVRYNLPSSFRPFRKLSKSGIENWQQSPGQADALSTSTQRIIPIRVQRRGLKSPRKRLLTPTVPPLGSEAGWVLSETT